MLISLGVIIVLRRVTRTSSFLGGTREYPGDECLLSKCQLQLAAVRIYDLQVLAFRSLFSPGVLAHRCIDAAFVTVAGAFHLAESWGHLP